MLLVELGGIQIAVGQVGGVDSDATASYTDSVLSEMMAKKSV